MDQVAGVEMVQALGHIKCNFSAPALPPEMFRHNQDDLDDWPAIYGQGPDHGQI